jgi:predicted esterase
MRRIGNMRAVGLCFVIILTLCVSAQAAAMDLNAAVKLGRRYLTAGNAKERRQLASQLDDYQGDIEPVLMELRQRTYRTMPAGYRPAEHFLDPKLRNKHPDDLLYFVVPDDYRPDRPTGLIVFLHGGGKHTPRQAPQATLRFPTPDMPPANHCSGDMLAATGMIAVGPSAPWNEKSYYRWCLREADVYLSDVILECKRRYNIDPDRVFLIGHSMGGFGAYQHIQRQPDRFAAVVANSGSWSLAYWPAVRGTPLCIVQGKQDARPGVRWHYTDVEYGRWTDKILSREKLDHVYLEHDGRHGFGYGREKVAEYLKTARQLRRDPYYPHVALASPAGFQSSSCFPVVHNRWLTLDEAIEGDLEFDELVSHGNDFESWRLEHRIGRRRGAAVEAVNRGGNSIDLAAKNVARCTVWLHPKMVDVSKPVVIAVNGRTVFQGRVRPSLAVALESFRRRNDWGLIYPIKVALTPGL